MGMQLLTVPPLGITSLPVPTNQGGTGAALTPVIGDLLYASSTTVFARLAAVATGQVLVSAGTGTAPAWSSTPTFTATNVTGLPIAGITGLGTGVGTALAATVTGSGGIALATAPTLSGQVLTQDVTTTSPGFYSQLTGDTFPRVRVGLNASDIASISFGPGSGARDLFLERSAAATLRFGQPDAAAPVAQTLLAQSVVAGTSNTAGAAFTIGGSKGTGTGTGGSLIFQVAPAGSTGTAQNALATALTIDSTKLATFAAGIQAATVALGGATIGSNVIAATGSANISGTIQGGILASSNQVTAGATSYIGFTGRTGITAPADAQILFGDSGGTKTFTLTVAGVTATPKLQFGAADVASGAIAQTLTFQGNTGSTTNGPLAIIQGAGGGSSTSVGGELRLQGGLSSAAAGTGGAVTIYTAPASAGATAALVATFGADKSTTLAGALGVAGVITGGGYANNAVQAYGWTGRTLMFSDSDGTARWTNNAQTNSVTFTVGAANLLTLNGGLTTTLATFILKSAATITGGATGNVPTLTAGPVTGNPTKWLPYDDNGTTRYIPAW